VEFLDTVPWLGICKGRVRGGRWNGRTHDAQLACMLNKASRMRHCHPRAWQRLLGWALKLLLAAGTFTTDGVD
jgi:hypothetical protein